ncbi:hypothetical protein NM2001068_2139 [Neisseria meningitidis 2001068]|nr:hypothetical protein NM2001068_2139 [Neisseria meningitidis 2001068]
MAQRRLNGAQDDLYACVLVGIAGVQVFQSGTGAQQGYAAACDHAFFNGCAGSVQRVFHAVFFLFHFDFGSGADFDHCHAACQFSHALLQFFFVVIAGCGFDLLADFGNTRFDLGCVAKAVDDGGVFFTDFDAFGLTQVFQSRFFQRQADFFGNHHAAGQDSDVLQHRFAAVAEARSFDGNGFQDASDVVHHQSRQGFAFYVFSDNQQRTAGFRHLFQNRQQVADVADFFVKQQYKRIVQSSDLFFSIVDEVRGQVAAVELHTFNHVQLVFQRFAVFNGNHAFFADFFHRFGDNRADLFVRVGGNRADLGDFFGSIARFGDVFQLVNQSGDGFVDTAFQVGRIHTCGNIFHAFGNDGLCQYGGGSRTVARHVVGFGRNFFHHLRAHIFKLVFQFDFFGDGYAVFGDVRAAESAVNHYVAAFGTQGYAHGVCQNVHAVYHFLADFIAELYVFCCHFNSPKIIKTV